MCALFSIFTGNLDKVKMSKPVKGVQLTKSHEIALISQLTGTRFRDLDG